MVVPVDSVCEMEYSDVTLDSFASPFVVWVPRIAPAGVLESGTDTAGDVPLT